MGGDSCSNGHEFESRHRILDGHFFTFICCKNCYPFEKTKMNEKDAGVCPLKNNVETLYKNNQWEAVASYARDL